MFVRPKSVLINIGVKTINHPLKRTNSKHCCDNLPPYRIYIKCSLRFSACSRTISDDWWSHADNFNCVFYLQKKRILEFSDYPCAAATQTRHTCNIACLWITGISFSFAVPVNCILCNPIHLSNRKSMSFWSGVLYDVLYFASINAGNSVWEGRVVNC